MRFLPLLLFTIIASLATTCAQDRHNIEVNLKDFPGNEIILGYYMGDNQYVKDTTERINGKFAFEGDYLLPKGIYMVIIPPHNDIIQMLVDDDQEFYMQATYDNGVKDVSFKGHFENELYYDYVNFIQDKRPESEEIRALLDSTDQTADTKEYRELESRLKTIDGKVEEKAQSIIDAHPESYTALVLQTNQEIDIPEFEGNESEVQLKRFHYFKKKYFEQMFLSDDRMFRTPYLFESVNYYTDKLTMRNPDSIMLSVDQILKALENNEEAFQYYLVHFLNKYAKSKIVGHDGIYVHIAENYYGAGKAPWTDAEQLNKILKNARELKPTLIGNTAPNLSLQDRSGTAVNLHDFDAEYTVIYFWNPDCGHCKKTTPSLIEFHNNYKDKGVQVISICGKTGKDLGECWEYIDTNEGMELFYNLADEYYKSRFKSIYYVKTTPKLFVLDRDKKIVSKGIGAEQLPDLMKYLLSQGTNN